MSVEPRIAELIEKQLRREICSGEKKELEAWVNANPARRLWILEIYKQPGWEEMRADQDKEDVCRSASLGGSHINIWRRTATAVAAGILVVVSFRLLYTPPDDYDPVPLPAREAMTQPGDHLRLILPDGENILPDKLPVDGIMEEKGWKIEKRGSHTVEVHISSNAAISRNLLSAGYYTFTVPYGQSWQMTLPDNSRVQLAPGSVLSYKVSSPTRTGIVAVLGTCFSVRDYAREDDFRATLVSGVIRLHRDGKTAASLSLQASC